MEPSRSFKEPPPINDSCAGALSVGLGDTPFDLAFASNSGVPYGPCGTASTVNDPHDMWFRYTSISGGPTGLLICDAPPFNGALIEVFDGGDCNTALPLRCTNSGAALACGISPSQRPGFLFPAVAGQDYLIRVARNGSEGYAGTLTIKDGFSMGSLGMAYCAGVPNSTGMASDLAALGSTALLANDFTLASTDLPPGAFTLFLVSRDQGFIANPGSSFGNLCLGGTIGRYSGPDQIQPASALGEVRLILNLADIPQVFNGVPALPGETWNWQAWYRDTSGGQPGSNFTNGISVLLE